MGCPTVSCNEREAAGVQPADSEASSGLHPSPKEQGIGKGPGTAVSKAPKRVEFLLPLLNLLVMVDLPLVHKDTTPLGDVEAPQTCVSGGTGEGESSVKLRATVKSPGLPHCVSPTSPDQVHGPK